MGGTFDPIHNGHLAAAAAAADALALERVLFIPSHRPPHRPAAPRVSGYQRFALVALAIAGEPRFAASDLELSRPGPSFTADTLRRLQDLGHTPSQLFFILGSDAFAEIATWHDYPAVLDLACFVVVSRPGSPPAVPGEQEPALAQRMVPVGGDRAVVGLPAEPGRILLLAARTPDVSSTMIRNRLANGEDVAGLLPPLVEGHVRRHGLYLSKPRSPGRQLA
jgi:nicotinate-nucleotide adenylyltransferase